MRLLGSAERLRFHVSPLFLFFLFILVVIFEFFFFRVHHISAGLYIVYGTHKLHFLATFLLKISPTVLFTHLKIILLQYFQFSVK